MNDVTSAEAFIAKAPWRFAATMRHIPHSYTVRGHTPDVEFEAFVRLIRERGQVAGYGSFRTTYLKVGKHKYWTMGEPVEKTMIINRCHEDDEFGELRDISGSEIDDRRRRWESLDEAGKADWWRQALERG